MKRTRLAELSNNDFHAGQIRVLEGMKELSSSKLTSPPLSVKNFSANASKICIFSFRAIIIGP